MEQSNAKTLDYTSLSLPADGKDAANESRSDAEIECSTGLCLEQSPTMTWTEIRNLGAGRKLSHIEK